MDLRLLRYFVAVAEELHFGRAAARLRMTQPPLSRAVRRLEAELGVQLLRRSSSGVSLTGPGQVLLVEARGLMAAADRVRAAVDAAAGQKTLTLGTLPGGIGPAGARLVETFRERHPGVRVLVREADFTDPTAGLRAGTVDVALTRLPFDDTGIDTVVIGSEPIGVLMRTDDPLAGRDQLRLDELRDRRWFRLPDDVDPVLRAYWSGPTGGVDDRDRPVVRTLQECLESTLWSGCVGLVPCGHDLPAELTAVPLVDKSPSRLAVAWLHAERSPLVRSFVHGTAVLRATAGLTA